MSTRVGAEPIHVLTSLRFLTAIWVVMHHYGGPLASQGFGGTFLDRGWSGVALFFVLSGFILAVNYPVERLETRSFLRARFARVYPVYALGCLLALPLYIDGNRYALMTFAENLRETFHQCVFNGLLIQAWIPDHAAVLNRAGWSLSVEAFFYVAFVPLLAWKTTRAILDRTWVALVGFWILGIGLVAVWKFAHPGLLPVPGLRGDDAWNVNFCSFHPLMRLPEFLIGIALGRWHLRGGRLPRPGLWVLASAASVVVLVFALPFEMVPYLHNTLLALPFGMVILGFAQLRGRVTDWLRRPWPVLLGEASYALYILHMPIHDWMRFASFKLGIPTDTSAWALAYLAVAVGVSVFVFRRFETPVRRWIRSWGEDARKGAAA